MAGLNFLTTNGFSEGWRSEDQFQRQRESDYLGIDARRFDLGERQRKSAEAQMIDAVLGEAAGMDDTRISGTRSTSAPGLDRPARAYAAPAPAGRAEPVYTTEELSPPAPNQTPTFAPGGPPQSAYAEPGMGIYDRGASGLDPSPLAQATIRQEVRPSDPDDARNPLSSAMGRGQFLKDTWLEVWPRLVERPGVRAFLASRGIDDPMRLSRNEVLQMRAVRELQGPAIDAYAEMNTPGLRSALGRDPSQGDLRLAHGFGPGGARALLAANPDVPIESIVGPKAMAANPHLAGKTAGDIVRQYDSTRGFVPARQPPGGGEDAMLRQAMGGTPDAMVGRVPTPQQVAMGRQIEGVPGYQEAAGRDWERDIVAQAGGGMAGGAPTDFLSSRFTDPRMQYARQRLAQTPGGGAMAFGMVQNQLTDRDKIGLKVFDLIGQGKDQEAMLLAGQIGMNLPPGLLRNPLMRQAVADIAKIPGLQYDSAAAVRYIREFVKNGGNSAAALDAMGDPRSRVDMPARGAGAPYSFINRADGSLMRVNKATGESETIVQPGRPDQARARAAHAATEAVKNGTIPPGQYAVYMATMERALLGDPNALTELEQVITPPKAPPDTRGWTERLPFVGEPAPTAPPRPSMANPPAGAPAMPAAPQAPSMSGGRNMIFGGAADYQPVAPRMSYDPATDSLVPVQ